MFSWLVILLIMSNSAETNGPESMRIDPQRAKLLAENLGYVAQQVQKVGGGRKVRHAQTLMSLHAKC
jgi:hypothetical protein